MQVSIDRTLGEVVTDEPAAARVLESFGLDYCCGGRQALGEACARRGIAPDAVIDALAGLAPTPPVDWARLGPAELADHIEATHHAYLHAELPRLEALAARVAVAHGSRHPELVDVRSVVATVRADLEPHLLKEERVLFPMIRELAAAGTGTGTGLPPTFHCGSIRNPISRMLAEHETTGELLATLRSLTGDYQVPADGCASYRALYDGLVELETDTHLHVHKENNVLFPAVVALESATPPAPEATKEHHGKDR